MTAVAGPDAGPDRAAPRGVADYSGLLRVDKPSGVTSHDVVEAVRRRLKVRSAGHLGTLDPAASGLLLIAIGAATRCIPVWQGGEKTYDATVRLGLVTSTQDLQGEVLERHEVAVDEARVRAAARAFTGEIEQVPPMVSAIKVRGQRLYKLARRGETVERAPRRVRVSSWEWLGFELPDARFRVRCSGGTYVRTLAHDLGASLGTGGTLAALRRIRSEPFGLEGAVTLRELDTLDPGEVLERAGMPLDRALEVLPAVTLDPAQAEQIGRGGRPVVDPGAAPRAAGARSVVLRDRDGRALALGSLEPDPADPGLTRACPQVVFPWAVRTGRP